MSEKQRNWYIFQCIKLREQLVREHGCTEPYKQYNRMTPTKLKAEYQRLQELVDAYEDLRLSS